MPSKRIDELTTRTVLNTDLLPPTPSGGPSGSATVAAVVKAGLQQPNSASAGAGADITIRAADGVTSGAGGSIILTPGAQATTGGNGSVIIRPPAGVDQNSFFRVNHHDGNACIQVDTIGYFVKISNGEFNFGYGAFSLKPGNYIYASAYAQFNIVNPIIQFPTAGGNVALLYGDVGVVRVSNGSTGGGSLAYTSSTPAAITANQNNYVLTGSAFQRLNCTTASDITGIAPPTSGAHVDGRMIRVVSVGSATVTLKHNSSSSTAANRIYSSTGADLALATNQWADLIYDSTDNGSGAAGWRAK